MTRRRLRSQEDLRAHLDWLRVAIRDRRVDVRLIVEGLLDVVDELVPGPPATPPGEP
jgi:hypothetical protein